MKKILHILGSMNRGGAETFIMNTYRNIDRVEYQFDFLLNSLHNDYQPEIESMGGNVFVMLSRREVGIGEFCVLLDDFFNQHQGEYVAVHCHISSLSSIEALKIAKKHNIPIRVAHSHSTNQKGWKHKVLHYANKPFITEYANRFLACSKVASDWLFGFSMANKRAVVVNNGIDLANFQFNPQVRESLRRDMGIQDKIVFGHVGRFCEVKNHKFLIEIFNQYLKTFGNAHLLLVGKGELMEQARRQVEELAIEDNVSFLGLREDIAELVQAMDIFLFPSLYEGLPVALVEAQAAGLRVYCSDGISKEVAITDRCKFIALSCSAQEWAKIIDNDRSMVRVNQNENIKKAGYDINKTVKYLIEEVYLE